MGAWSWCVTTRLYILYVAVNIWLEVLLLIPKSPQMQ